ncbi:hypothetical protein BJY04DRAFT_176033 [Aspergillus karnatakaensis]|uniref:uncharacterized protein n=1 Tax=Aspergillus karnatakaensis TaxID=1810916 RepID=UPI003CCD1E62
MMRPMVASDVDLQSLNRAWLPSSLSLSLSLSLYLYSTATLRNKQLESRDDSPCIGNRPHQGSNMTRYFCCGILLMFPFSSGLC